MRELFRKGYFLSALLLLTFGKTATVQANDCSYGCNRFYVGAFGGQLYSNSPELRQTGTAFFLEASGGPLAVDARGFTDKTSPGFAGLQVGYAWGECPFYIGCSNWSVTSGVEAEAFFYKERRRGDLINIAQTRLDEHDFHDTFNLFAGVYLANLIFTFDHCCLGRFAPYVGVGIGVGHLHARNADSLQVSPPEAGVNHFNSKRNDSSWTFAVQTKAGVQYCLCTNLRLFAEYRFLSLDPSRYTFGSTVYPAHAATSPWTVDLAHTMFNGFALGFQLDL